MSSECTWRIVCVCVHVCIYILYLSFTYRNLMRSFIILKSVNHPVSLEFATQPLESVSVLLAILEQTAV